MITRTLSWIAEKVQGKLLGQDLTVNRISTDTRTLQPGDVYLALVGENFDGHDFCQRAIDSGAAAVVVSREVGVDIPSVMVADTKLALGHLGAAVKAEVAPKTVAVTGSCGKTTVKEMTAAILRCRGKVLATKGNFNNDIGVPLTLLELQDDHEYAVIELGANHLGEIAYTTSLVKPQVATIVNAAASHLEGFGSLFGVARAKSEIFSGLEDNSGVAIVNADSQFADYWFGKVKYKKSMSFSLEDSASNFYARDISIGLDGCAAFELVTPEASISVQLQVPGMHNVGNAVLAAALATRVGATLQDVQYGLLNMAQVDGRLKVKELTSQVRLLDDTYNANVASVNAAIDTLSSFSGVKVLVLGDMAELGEKSRYYHEEVGRYAQSKGIDYIFTLGVLSQHASAVFAQSDSHHSDLESLVVAIESQLAGEQRDISILIKGSRSAKMERVVTALEASTLGKFERRRERIAC